MKMSYHCLPQNKPEGQSVRCLIALMSQIFFSVMLFLFHFPRLNVKNRVRESEGFDIGWLSLGITFCSEQGEKKKSRALVQNVRLK